MEFPDRENLNKGQSSYDDYVSKLFPDRKVLKKEKMQEDDGFNRDLQTVVLEEQKLYTWIRVYLNEEDNNLEPGDKVYLKYEPSGEELELLFACYDKKGLVKDEEEVVEYDSEDDKKVLCLMLDMNEVNYRGDHIPFIRTLFKESIHFEYQVYRRHELKVISKDKDIEFEYYNIDL